MLAQAGPAAEADRLFGTGVDHIDLEAARQRGITVTNTPGVLTEDTADMTMALILAVSRRLAEGERLARAGEWTGWSPTSMLGRRIWGKRLGIVGMGRIGSAAGAARQGLRPVGPLPQPPPRARRPSSRSSRRPIGRASTRCWRGWTSSSVNCPHTPATFHLLSARRLKLLQPHAILVNTAAAR